MGTRQRFAAPDGWVVRGFRFEVGPTSPEQRGRIFQHFAARRFAYNWALAQVKENLAARKADPSVAPLAWNFYQLRKAWNQAKDEVAPWWPACSKEAYASGIADLVAALGNWSNATVGRRKGARVGFPRFHSRRRDRGRVRFTTGVMRLEPDRRHVTLPVIGRLRTKESTRRLERLVAKGRARVLSMTLSEHGGRLFVAVAAIVRQQPRTPAEPSSRCGVDLGIGQEWAVVAHADGTIERIDHPAPWVETQRERRRVARQMSRRIVGSRGHRAARAKLATLDLRIVNLRREAVHQLTTSLARRYGSVVIEDLDLVGMSRSMGRRAFRRTVAQAGLGMVRPTLGYKTQWGGGQLMVADRWFASSKAHHGCGGYRADLKLRDRVWECPRCRQQVDRNTNAALNLRDWTGAESTTRVVQRGGVAAPGAVRGRPRRAGSPPRVGVRDLVRPPSGGRGR